MESKSYSYRYNAWFGSIVSQAKLLSGQAGLLPELYYDFLYRDGRRTAIAMAGGGSSFNDAAKCVKALGRARLVPAYDAVSGGYAISFDGGKFSVDAAEYDEDGFVHFLETLGREYVLTDSFADPADGTVNVVILSRSEPEGMVTTPVEAFITRTGRICQVLRHINIFYVSLASITIVNRQLNFSHSYNLFHKNGSRRVKKPSDRFLT